MEAFNFLTMMHQQFVHITPQTVVIITYGIQHTGVVIMAQPSGLQSSVIHIMHITKIHHAHVHVTTVACIYVCM